MSRHDSPIPAFLAVIGIIVAFGLMVLFASARTVPAGHVAAATYFGQVQATTYEEGFHFVNPFLDFVEYDCRQKTHKETTNVPSQDQLATEIDVSVQYRIDPKQTANILKNTGKPEDLAKVHLVPKLRSLMREQGKSVKRAEDFFLEATQTTLQTSLTEQLKTYLGPKGLIVDAVLLRDIRLPQFIVKSVESKKQREQEAEREKAELRRFETEQQKKVKIAQAELEAARQEAERKKVLADAEAYQIQKMAEVLRNNPAYIQLQSLEALKAISKDPSSKLYFINGDSPQPLPLMNLGTSFPGTKAKK